MDECIQYNPGRCEPHLIPDKALEAVLVTEAGDGPVLSVGGQLLTPPHPLQVQQHHTSVHTLQRPGLPNLGVGMLRPERRGKCVSNKYFF